ncbi:MAG: YceI family protein [Caldilineaceae bacterium]|nr:YceI family protein [Caldilineaceae bacterium]
MVRKLILPLVLLVTLAMLVACAPESTAPAAAPQAEESAAESVAEPTAVPVEEAEPTAEAGEEAAAESDDAAAAAGETATYVVDTEASVVEWYGSKPIGASEAGTVDIASGALTFDGDQLVEGSFVIDMGSIETTTQSGGMANQLVGHLASDDFFGVETYPTATLVIKSATPTDMANQYAVVADLTIKATTQEIEFITDVVVGEGTLTATADIIVNRAEFDVRYGSGSFFSDLGDDLISDEMEMTVTLVTNQS